MKVVLKAIHQVVEVAYKDCPAAWKTLKQQIMIDEQRRREFIKKLQDVLGRDRREVSS